MTVTITGTLCYSLPCAAYLFTLPSGNQAVIVAQASFGQLMLFLVAVAVLFTLLIVAARQWMHS